MKADVTGRLVRYCLVAPLVVLLMTGCSRELAEQDTSAGTPVDGIWTLESFGPAAALGETAAQLKALLIDLPVRRSVTLDLTETGRAAGHAGCNRYFSDFTLEDGVRLTIGPVGTTRMACEESLMALEQAFLQALTSATTVVANGEELELRNDDGTLLAFRRKGQVAGA